jgi:tryprostatin B 6-hydroxylase
MLVDHTLIRITHAHRILLALREYEGRVRGFTDELMSQLNARSGEVMNASRWFNYFSFDMMGDMAFGKSFDMLKTGETVCPIPQTIL